MPISSHLLERAYQLIDANQFQNAELVLNAVVRLDPQNADAWKAYLQIYQDPLDLAWLMERILKTRELSDQDKKNIIASKDRPIQQINDVEQDMDMTTPISIANINQNEEKYTQKDTVFFELIDMFDYPSLKIEPVKKRRPRHDFIYKIPASIWYLIALLAVFYLGVRLLVLGYVIGYMIIGAFAVGGGFWLRKFGNHKNTTPHSTARAYSFEHENELYIMDKPIKEKIVDANKKEISSHSQYFEG